MLHNSWKLLPIITLSVLASAHEIFHETLYPSWGQTFTIESTDFIEKTDHQELIIFSNARFGKCLALDGALQVTEQDEFFYHESFAHIPFYAHGRVRSVLVIGGGDGGMIRELLRHQSIEKVDLVELDDKVVSFSQKHLPFLSRNAFDDPRLHLFIQDGATFIKQTKNMYDLILVDSPDPVGEALSLFSEQFYQDCQRHLNKGGIFANQAGVPFMQPQELALVHKGLSKTFDYVEYFFTSIPSYVGGQMAFGFASDTRYRCKYKALKQRIEKEGLCFKHYNPQVHQASFAPSQFIVNILAKPQEIQR